MFGLGLTFYVPYAMCDSNFNAARLLSGINAYVGVCTCTRLCCCSRAREC
jgi:hypothetical protein